MPKLIEKLKTLKTAYFGILFGKKYLVSRKSGKFTFCLLCVNAFLDVIQTLKILNLDFKKKL